MNYFVFVLLFGGCFCGGNVHTVRGSGRRGRGIPVFPEMTRFQEAFTVPEVGYNEYYSGRSLSFPIVPSYSMTSSEMAPMQGISRDGYYYGRNIGFPELKGGDFARPTLPTLHRRNFYRDVRGVGAGAGRGGRGPGRSILSGYPPSEYHSIVHSGYYPKSRVPLQYAGYHHGYGYPDFVVTGKSNDDTKRPRENYFTVTAVRSGEGPWKIISESAFRKDGAKSSDTIMKAALDSAFKSFEDNMAFDFMPWKNVMKLVMTKDAKK